MDQTTVIRNSWNLLRFAYGITLIIIGLDKVLHTNYIVNWEGYVSPFALSILPFSALTIATTLGIAEILVGVLMVTQWTRLAAILTIATLILIILNLLTMHLYDIAARDFLIGCGALVLLWLTQSIPNSKKWL